jgi:CBS-domain-containing membrane protein
MSRSDEHLDAMFRHLGSVYYQTLQGLASASEVTKAVQTVREHEGAEDDRSAVSHRPHGRWRVGDVMITDVITVDKHMPYKQVARVLTESNLSAVPVVSQEGQVLGMISEADMLRKEERPFGRLATGLPRRTRRERRQADALTAGGLMTAPAITIHQDAPVGAAARLLNGRHIRRLPVVDATGKLIGIVSRGDLLGVFLQSDSDISAEVSTALRDLLVLAPGRVTVTAADGVVTLAGEMDGAAEIDAAIRIAGAADGVVAVTNRLTSDQEASSQS